MKFLRSAFFVLLNILGFVILWVLLKDGINLGRTDCIPERVTTIVLDTIIIEKRVYIPSPTITHYHTDTLIKTITVRDSNQVFQDCLDLDSVRLYTVAHITDSIDVVDSLTIRGRLLSSRMNVYFPSKIIRIKEITDYYFNHLYGYGFVSKNSYGFGLSYTTHKHFLLAGYDFQNSSIVAGYGYKLWGVRRKNTYRSTNE